MKFRFIIFFLTGLFLGSAFSQEDFVRYCRFNSLKWSPKGTELAFTTRYYEEGQNETPSVQILIKNLKTETLTCINPLPQRFTISRDKRFLLFSSLYGIYIMDLNQKNRCSQLTGLDPTGDQYIQKLGFLKGKLAVYWVLNDYSAGNIIEKYIQIHPDSFKVQPYIQSLRAETLTVDEVINFSLRVDGPRSTALGKYHFPAEKYKVVFRSRTGNEYDLMNLIQIDLQTEQETIIMEKFRPRLFSINPAKTHYVISTWQTDNSENTWYSVVGSNSVMKISNWSLKFISWLSPEEFVGLSAAGLFLYNIKKAQWQRLDNWILPEWYAVNLNESPDNLPAAASHKKMNAKRGTQIAEIEESTGLFIRSRIIIRNDTTKTGTLLIPEMSNLTKKW